MLPFMRIISLLVIALSLANPSISDAKSKKHNNKKGKSGYSKMAKAKKKKQMKKHHAKKAMDRKKASEENSMDLGEESPAAPELPAAKTE